MSTAPSSTTPPVATGAPVLGAALALRRDPLAAHERAMREHGDVVRFVAGPPGARISFVAVYNPDGVQRVMAAESARYRKDNRFYDEVRWAFGDGLLNSQDERWRRQRRFLQPLFTRPRIAEYVALFADEAGALVDRWAPVAARGGWVDLHGEMTALALRMVARALFGTGAAATVPVMREATEVLGSFTLRRGFAPFATPPGWPTPANRRARRVRRAAYGACQALIADRRAHPTGGHDMLSLLLEARDGGQALDDAEVADQVLIFLLAGHDTTALALTFTLWLLARHPEHQDRVRREVGEVLDGRAPSAADLPALAYTGQVLSEALRLYPPAWVIGRRTAGGDRIGRYEIAPGSDVYVSPWATHRHPEVWTSPERFDPGRFSRARAAHRHPYAWMPFGAGPRACIGRHFALEEATVALAMLVRAYRFDAPATRVALAPAITLRPAGPLPCRIVPMEVVS